MLLTSRAFGESEPPFGNERITKARRIMMKNEQVISTENKSVEDDDFRRDDRE